MERFWTLKYLQQNGIGELVASVFKEGLARADELPLVLPVLGADGLPRGAKVRVKLGQIDEITLDVRGTVAERLDVAQEPQMAEEDTGDDEEPVAGPIAIAVDVNDTEETAAPAADNPGP